MASQFGGVPVDTPPAPSAGGSQFGGVPVTDQAGDQPAQVENPESAAGGFWKNVNPMPFLKAIKDAAESPEAALGPPGIAASLAKKFVPGIIQAHKDQLQKAVDAEQKGNHVEAFGHLLSGVVPLIGPIAGQAAETIGGTEAQYDKFGNVIKPGMKPDLSGGLGEAAGVLLPAALDVAGGATRAAAAKVAPGVAEGLYKGSLSRGYTAGSKTPAEIRALTEAGLENGIPVSEAGAEKMSQLLDQVQNQKEALLKRATAAGVRVDPNKVVQGLNGVERRFATQATPEKDLADINAVGDEFLRTQGYTPGTPATPPQPTGILGPNGQPIMSPGKPGVPARRAQPMTAEQAEQVKTGTQQAVERATGYGEQGSGRVEALKSLGHEIKTELERQIPELQGLHPKQQTFLDLEGVVNKAVNSAAKSNPGSLKALITTGVTEGLLKNHPTLAVGAGLLRLVLSNPEVRSRLAIAVNQAQQNNPARYGVPNFGMAWSRVNQLGNALDQFTQSPRNASQAAQ